MKLAILRIAGGGSIGKGQTIIQLVTQHSKDLQLLTPIVRLRTPHSPPARIEQSRSLVIDQYGIFERLQITRQNAERVVSRPWGTVPAQPSLVYPRFLDLANRLIAATDNPISEIRIDGPHFLGLVCDEGFDSAAAGLAPIPSEELSLVAKKLGASLVEYIETARTRKSLPSLVDELVLTIAPGFGGLSPEVTVLAFTALQDGLRDELDLLAPIVPEYQMHLR